MAGTFDQMLDLITVVSNPDRTKRALVEIRDAGATAARLEAERHSEGLSRREEAIEKRERELVRLADELAAREEAGAAIAERLQALAVRDGAATALEERLRERQVQIEAAEARLATAKSDLERRFSALRRAAMGPV